MVRKIPTEIASAECEIDFDFVFDLAHLFLKIDRWLHLILDDAIPNEICVLNLWLEEVLVLQVIFHRKFCIACSIRVLLQE